MKKLILFLFSTMILSCLSTPPVANEAVEEKTEETTEGVNNTVKKEKVDNQPYSPYWFPQEILQWSPETDEQAPFNRGSIALAERVSGSPINGNADERFKVAALSRMNISTSNNYAQGGHWFSQYTFHYWQYIDLLVMWGGSAGEGLIVCPGGDVIDSAHKNGVPVLGTIFFPPTYYGGTYQWVTDFLQRNEDGSFPVADKLIEAARYYRFDGWFINQETEGGNRADSESMVALIKYMEQKAPELHIMWYDAMTDEGKIEWQNHLTDRNMMYLQDKGEKAADSMFLNFWWKDQNSSAIKAEKAGISPFDIYAGIDVQAQGYNTKAHWEGIFNDDGPVTSLAFYCPGWTYHDARDKTSDFYNRANRFWVGESGDPSNTMDHKDDWKGVAHYAVAETTITELPFVTAFNTGNGKMFAVEGETVSRNHWNYRSLQDIPPTWQWIKRGPEATIQYDWDLAYYGGSSLQMAGDFSQEPLEVKLYKTHLLINEETELHLTYQSSDEDMDITPVVELSDGTIRKLSSMGIEVRGGWLNQIFSLQGQSGELVTAVSFLFNSSTGNQEKINLGQLKIMNSNTSIFPEKPGDLRAQVLESGYANPDCRLFWTEDKEVMYYEVYQMKSNGDREFLKMTPSNALYLSELSMDGEGKTTLAVYSVNKWHNRSEAAEILVNRPKENE